MVTTPMVVMGRIEPLPYAPVSPVNHSAPSGPDVMSQGLIPRKEAGNSAIPPTVVCPILLAADSVNHSSPSGPVVMPVGLLLAVGIGISVITPLMVMRPILSLWVSVNHSAPSGPAVMPQGQL